MKDLLLVGLGGHAKSIIDSIESTSSYRIAGYTDPVKKDMYKEYPCLGTDADLETLYKSGIRYAFVTVGYMGKGRLRDQLYKRLCDIGYILPVITDPSSVVSRNVRIGEGVFIGKRAVVNTGSVIGKMAIINTGAIIEHGNSVGEFSHIAVGASLCGDVSVGDHCLIGAGSTIIQGCQIGAFSVVGAGSIVLSDVDAGKRVVGIVKKEGQNQ